MAQPTTGVYFSQSTPAAPPGDQIAQPQTDGASPEQSVTFVPQRATTALRGTVKPDGTTITIDDDGTIHAVATSGSGGGGTGGGSSASGGLYVCVSPTQDPADGTRTQWILPAPQLAGTIGWLVRNDTMQRQLGLKAYFSVQGTQLTLTSPLEVDGYLEYYYIQGTPSSETGGGGSVTPVTAALVRATSTGAGSTGGSSVIVSFPSGTQVGDLLVICCNNDWNLTVPSGWTNNNLSNGVTWNGMVISKVMTSGDIATGSVTISAAGNDDWAYIATAFIGAVGGVRETSVVSSSGPHTDIITTSSAVAATDVALYFGSERGLSAGVFSISRGAAQDAVTGPNSQSNLNTEALTAAGAYSTNFVYTTGGGGGTYSAVIIVKAF